MPTPIKNLECFVFDMDGTINLGNTLIPGALELIESCAPGVSNFSFSPIIPPNLLPNM